METQICCPPAYSRGLWRAQQRNKRICLGESCLFTFRTDARPSGPPLMSLEPLEHRPSTAAQSSSEIESLGGSKAGVGMGMGGRYLSIIICSWHVNSIEEKI